MNAWRVRDWERHFENAGSRKVNLLSWVAIPNRHDSAGFRRVMAQPDGVAIYGAFMLMVQVATKMPQRGVLANEDGPLDADDLAVRTGAPATAFARALEVLSTPKIGWIEQVDTTASGCTGSTLPAGPAQTSLQDRTGQTVPDPTRYDMTNKTEQAGGPGPDFSNSFLTGSDRGRGRTGADTQFRNRFALLVAQALGIHPERVASQRRSLLAVAGRMLETDDPEAAMQRCIEVAKEKATAGMDNPAAAWQAAIDKIYPRPPERLRLAEVG